MKRSAIRATPPPTWRSRFALVGLLLLVPFLVAATPPGAVAPFGEADSGSSATARAVLNQADPEPGIVLMTAVYNSLEDRFFRRVDSRSLLQAAWDGAGRGLSDQRRRPRDVQAPTLIGDRAADLAAFVTQYRALLASAGPASTRPASR